MCSQTSLAKLTFLDTRLTVCLYKSVKCCKAPASWCVSLQFTSPHLQKGPKLSGAAGARLTSSERRGKRPICSPSFSECACSVCRSALPLLRRENCNFRTVHRNCETFFPPESELRKSKVKQQKSRPPKPPLSVAQTESWLGASTTRPSHTQWLLDLVVSTDLPC